MATWPPDSSKKAPNVFINATETGLSSAGRLTIKSTPFIPEPLVPPQPPVLIPWIMNNAPGLSNPNITLLPWIMNVPIPPITLLPWIMNNAPSFVNPNITTLPWIMNNASGFSNPNITTLPWIMNNASGFSNPNITVLPWAMSVPSNACTTVGPAIDSYVGTTINSSYSGTIAYGLGMFAGIGFVNSSPYPSYTVYSTDNGKTWVQTATGVNAEYRVTVAGNDRFVAVTGNSGAWNRNAVSLDGKTWTHYTNMPSTNLWYGLGFGNKLFMAGNFSGGIATSTDGITWAAGTTPMSSIDAIGYGGGVWVAVSRSITTPYISTNNGANWTASTVVGSSLLRVGFSNNIFFVTAISASTIWYSTNFGTSWTSITMPATGFWKPPVWTGDIWMTEVAVSNIATVYWSTNLTTWTPRTPLAGSGDVVPAFDTTYNAWGLYRGFDPNNFVVACKVTTPVCDYDSNYSDTTLLLHCDVLGDLYWINTTFASQLSGPVATDMIGSRTFSVVGGATMTGTGPFGGTCYENLSATSTSALVVSGTFSNTNTDSLTFDLMVYYPSGVTPGAYRHIFQYGTALGNRFNLAINAGFLAVYNSGNGQQSGTVFPTNQWVRLSVVLQNTSAGNWTRTVYQNNVSVLTQSGTAVFGAYTNASLYYGTQQFSTAANDQFIGRISSVRIAAIAKDGTYVGPYPLVNYGVVRDWSSYKRTMWTNNFGITINTTQQLFGAGCLSFPGGSFIRIPYTADLNLTNKEVFLEGAATINSYSANNTIIDARGTSAFNTSWSLYAGSNRALLLYDGPSNSHPVSTAANALPPAGTRFRWALSRKGVTVTLWIDGIPIASGTYNFAATNASGINIGIDNAGAQSFAGVMDEIRFTNFCRQTAAYPLATLPFCPIA